MRGRSAQTAVAHGDKVAEARASLRHRGLAHRYHFTCEGHMPSLALPQARPVLRRNLSL